MFVNSRRGRVRSTHRKPSNTGQVTLLLSKWQQPNTRALNHVKSLSLGKLKIGNVDLLLWWRVTLIKSCFEMEEMGHPQLMV